MRSRWSRSGGGRLASAVLLAVVFPALAQAGQVVPMTLSEISDLAGQVIVGEVASVRSYWAERPRRIESEVTFKGVEYLKGALPDSTTTFTLIVPGGRVDEWEMRISCAPIFATGEKWILFLLPTYKTFPLVGLNQGGFRVEQDAEGVARVYDASQRAVAGLGPDGFVQVMNASADGVAHQQTRSAGGDSSASAQPAASGGDKPTGEQSLVAANGVRVRFVGPPAVPRPALSYDEFVATIRPVLDRSKKQALTSAAGRPDPSPRVAVPMHWAPSPAGTGKQGASTGAGPAEGKLRSRGVLPPRADDRPREPRVPQRSGSEKAEEVGR